MTTARALVRGIGWFRAGRSVPLPLGAGTRRGRIYWLTLPFVELGVHRRGFQVCLGPDYAFLSLEVELHSRPVRVGFVTDGWRDW